MSTPNDYTLRVKAAVEIIQALGDAVRQLGSVPSGHLYATVCDVISLEAYERAISVLKLAGLVTESNHLLTWIGHKPAETPTETAPALNSLPSEVKHA